MLLNVDQASLSHFLGCRNSSISELGTIDLPASGPAEVICPKPFRPRASRMIDDVDRNWPRQEGGLTSDLLDLFPAEPDKEDVPDVSGCDRGFLSWSTPQRTDNPLVYDALFISRTLAHPSCSSPGSEPAVT